jgi:hypothetical protein
MLSEAKVETGKKIPIMNEQRHRANEDFVKFLAACPHVIPPNIGVEQFEQELEKALDKWVIFNTRTLEIDEKRYI